jgi:hypothetical protein
LEFEINSHRFKEQGHDVKKCDVIICWKHGWDDCPMDVFELSSLNYYCVGEKDNILRRIIKEKGEVFYDYETFSARERS